MVLKKNDFSLISLTKDEETIIAQCTPSGTGAIALLRLSGSNVRNIVKKISKFPKNKNLLKLRNGTIHFGWVVDDVQNIIDQVMFIILDGPTTFTGQNTIEITCHNNPFLIEAVINQAVKSGARIAQEGEFTKRAFLNGKLDLIQAEAINDLIHANNQLAIKKSLQQVEGSFSRELASIELQLTKALAWSEASFEFLDDEQAQFGKQIKNQLQKVVSEIKNLKKTFDAQQQIKQGIKIALIGSVNAGKSSIFNKLLNQNRAIVSKIAGTTRDVIESGLYLNGNYLTFVDTAGIRQTEDIIEKEGINRSIIEAQKADIILLIFDGSVNISEEEHNFYKKILKEYNAKTILICNKSDLNKNTLNKLNQENYLSFSCQTNRDNKNIKYLHDAIEKKVFTLFSALESPFLLNKRQYNILVGLEKKLEQIINMLNEPINYELISYHLNDALCLISELTGKSISEAGLEMVFKEFCVGK